MALATPVAKGSTGPDTAGGASAALEITLSTPAPSGGAEQMCGFPAPTEHLRLFSHTWVKLSSRDAEPWKFGGE